MALVKCKECNSSVSDQSKDCPKCGATLRKPKRSFFGKIIKWMFILFNILMIYWVVAGFMSATDGYEAMSEAQKSGTAVGTAIGMSFVIGIWVAGDIILGLFVLLTRPK